MISVMTLLYVCPMEMAPGRNLAMAAAHSSCEGISDASGSFSLNKLNVAGDCVNIRLALVGQTLKNLIGTMDSFYLLVVLSIFVGCFLARKVLINWSRSSFVRLRHFFRYYQTSIKLFTEKKLKEYLNLLGNYTVVSIG